MKNHVHILSIVFVGVLAVLINGCNQGMDTVVDMVMDSPPSTEPVAPAMQPSTDQSDTFHGSLDHQSPIHAVAFSPDGQTLVSLGEESLKFWDPYIEELNGTLPFEGEIRWIYHEQDGNLVVGGPDSLPGFVTGHTSLVRAFALTPDLETAATGSSDKTVRIWNTLTDTHKFTLEHKGQVWAVAFSPDGKTLASGGSFEGIHLWDATTGESKGPPLIAPTAQVESIAFGPEGQTLFVATGKGDGEAIHIWDLRTNQLTETLMAEGHTVRKVAVSPDGQLIVGGAYAPDGPGVLLWKRK